MSVEEEVDAVIREFDRWFQEKGNQPLVRSERAAIKTFCWFLANVTERSALPMAEERTKGDVDGKKAGG